MEKRFMNIFPLSDGIIFLLCVGGWLIWSVLMGFIAHRLPLKFLEKDTFFTKQLPWAEKKQWYEKVLKIKKWKDILPEGGDFFPGGFRKNSLGGRNYLMMHRFVMETRRAEYVHLIIWLFWLITIIWTPPWAVVINFIFATGFNLPCLLVQRYNRLRLLNVLNKYSQKQDPFLS
jgi:glycosyl-4,4'-diaponeurosporenoate acyltransferase